MKIILQEAYKIIYISSQTHLHTTACYLTTHRQVGNAMRKVLGGTKKKRFYVDDRPTMSKPNDFSKGSFEGKASGNSKRATVLNKLFMRHITDQMSTGEHTSEILGHGIEINKVTITPDYKIVKVYWFAKGTNDDIVNKILEKNAGLIRHELSQLRLMGNVPVIQFVKDKQFGNIMELDNRLAQADFGEDHVPLDPTSKLKTAFEIFAPIDTAIKEQIAKLETEDIEENYELPLPPMPQNVLGLDHAHILLRIQKLMKKSEALHRESSSSSSLDTDKNWVTFKLNQSVNNDPVTFSNQREAFKEFLHKRQLLKLKSKREKNYTPDFEYMKEELNEKHRKYLDQFDVNENDEHDYIIDDFEENNIK